MLIALAGGIGLANVRLRWISANPSSGLEKSPSRIASRNSRLCELSKLRLITNLDRAALATYCSAYALWAEAVEAIQQYGAMVKSPNGYPIQSPYVAIANRQAEIMLRISSEFGFTPASRGRIAAPKLEEPTLFESLDPQSER